MRLVTQTDRVSSVAGAWRRQYPKGHGSLHSGDSDAIWEKLSKLDHETATAADVANIIGNSSWAGPRNCDECGSTVLVTLEFGNGDSYVQICESCLVHALRLIKNSR